MKDSHSSKLYLTILGLVAAALLGGWLANELTKMGWQLSFKSDALSDLAKGLATFAGIALVVERSVESYLKASGYDTRPNDKLSPHDNTVPAVRAAIAIGLMLGVVGVRILDTLVAPAKQNYTFASFLYTGTDVLLSAGLLAGGAVVFHPLLKAITELLTAFQEAAKVRRIESQTRALDRELERCLAFTPIEQWPLQAGATPQRPSIAEMHTAGLHAYVKAISSKAAATAPTPASEDPRSGRPGAV